MTYDEFCAKVRHADRPEDWHEIAEFVSAHPAHLPLFLQTIYNAARYEMAQRQWSSSGAVVGQIDAQSFYDRRIWPEVQS